MSEDTDLAKVVDDQEKTEASDNMRVMAQAIQALKTRMTAAETDITDLDNRVTTIEEA